jgi:hypothetical protein
VKGSEGKPDCKGIGKSAVRDVFGGTYECGQGRQGSKAQVCSFKSGHGRQQEGDIQRMHVQAGRMLGEISLPE